MNNNKKKTNSMQMHREHRQRRDRTSCIYTCWWSHYVN